MHRLLIVPLFIVAVGGGAWFFNTYDQPLSFEHVLSSQEHVSTDVGEASASSRPELISGVALEGAREAIQVTRAERATEDPCDSVRAELETAILINNEHEKTIAQLNKKLAAATQELERLQFPESTPYGAFLSSPEAGDIKDPIVLARIEDWLRQFPVFLWPGEATWIAERTVNRDWGLYGPTSEEALIMFLGPARLVAELPPTRMAELRAYYAEEQIFD